MYNWGVVVARGMCTWSWDKWGRFQGKSRGRDGNMCPRLGNHNTPTDPTTPHILKRHDGLSITHPHSIPHPL